MGLDTFLGAFFGVALGELCRELYNRYFRSKTEVALDNIDRRLSDLTEKMKTIKEK